MIMFLRYLALCLQLRDFEFFSLSARRVFQVSTVSFCLIGQYNLFIEQIAIFMLQQQNLFID